MKIRSGFRRKGYEDHSGMIEKSDTERSLISLDHSSSGYRNWILAGSEPAHFSTVSSSLLIIQLSMAFLSPIVQELLCRKMISEAQVADCWVSSTFDAMVVARAMENNGWLYHADFDMSYEYSSVLYLSAFPSTIICISC